MSHATHLKMSLCHMLHTENCHYVTCYILKNGSMSHATYLKCCYVTWYILKNGCMSHDTTLKYLHQAMCLFRIDFHQKIFALLRHIHRSVFLHFFPGFKINKLRKVFENFWGEAFPSTAAASLLVDEPHKQKQKTTTTKKH